MARVIRKRVGVAPASTQQTADAFYQKAQAIVFSSLLAPFLVRDLVTLVATMYGSSPQTVVSGHPLIREQEDEYWKEFDPALRVNWALLPAFFDTENVNAVAYFLSHGARLTGHHAELIAVFSAKRSTATAILRALIDWLISAVPLRVLSTRYPLFVVDRLLQQGRRVTDHIDLADPQETATEVYETDNVKMFERLSAGVYPPRVAELAVEYSAKRIVAFLARKEVYTQIEEDVVDRAITLLGEEWRDELERQKDTMTSMY